MSEPAISYLRPPGDIASWVEQLLEPGTSRLGAQVVLADPMKRILRRQAVDLGLQGKAPDAPLRSSSVFIEAEVAPLTKAAAWGKLAREKGEALRNLQTLLASYNNLAVTAG